MFRNLPPVIKNLIILNVLMILAAWVIKSRFGVDLDNWLGYHYFGSKLFKPYQLVTYMFMHAPLGNGGFLHIFFNMYALFIFGVMLENVWGGRRFFIYYILCGLGAIMFQSMVNYFQFAHITHEFTQVMASYSPKSFLEFAQNNFPFLDFTAGSSNYNLLLNSGAREATLRFNEMMQMQMSIPTVGASGAVYGILLAFGMIFPNAQLMLLFPPIPIKAKWLVIIYGGIELSLGVTQSGSNIAHFAHLGGMIFGFILIKLWKRNRNNLY
jgi:membrane associated rhomboid family serine protease